MPPIYFDLIWNSSINAVALEQNGRYFIGIHTGTLFMLWTLIGRILSDASLFPEIGDPGQESGQLKPLEDYYPDAQEMLQVLSVMMPKNPIRASYACFLQDQATLFLIGHELAHVTLGHVAYLAKKGQGATREVGISGPQDENAILERQGIELDADGRSIMARIDSLRITYQNPDTSPIPWAPAAESPGRLIHDWAVSLGILFRIFGDERFSAASLAQSSYPPPLLRRIMCNSTALDTIVRFWSPELENIGRESLLTAQADTDRAFDTLLGISLPRTPYEGGGCLRFAPSFEKD